MRRYCLIALLTGCGTGGASLPKCGVELAGSITNEGSHLSEFELHRYLRYAIEAAAGTMDPRLRDPAAACSRLAGMRIFTHPDESFDLSNMRGLQGLTNCNSRWLIVNTPPSLTWGQSSLVHELFHGMQGCTARDPVDAKNPSHSNWRIDGISEAINQANARND